MSDLLLSLSGNATARKVVGVLRVPIPMPQTLERLQGPDVDPPLSGQRVLVGAAPGGEDLAKTLLTIAGAAGAEALTPGQVEADDERQPNAVVFDATGISDPAGLESLHGFFHPRVRSVARCGRVIVVARPPQSADDPAGAAAAAALDGFVRSLAKELGRKGTTVQLLRVDRGAEDRLEGVLRFLLCARSAYVSGQTWHITSATRAPSATPWTGPLSGKVALVTGAAQGIGAAIVGRLQEEGATVVGLDRPDALEQMAAVVCPDRTPDEALMIAADVTDADTPSAVATHLRTHHGGIDIVVHNAGVTRDRTLGKMNAPWWQLAIDVNLGAVVRLTDGLQSLLRDDARIVAMSSIAGIAGNPGQTNYAAAKAGLIGYVEALAPSLAERGITVNAVAPGFIETRMTDAMPMTTREAARRLNSLRQGGLPEDVANLVAFLVSPGASGISGRTLRVCGQHLSGA